MRPFSANVELALPNILEFESSKGAADLAWMLKGRIGLNLNYRQLGVLRYTDKFVVLVWVGDEPSSAQVDELLDFWTIRKDLIVDTHEIIRR